ncbi:sensor histidine kinase [Winogradskyella luteola]|uniref:Sensor histidine kinase n=1 Tax=Winogradskyella luteola TaxID=2828330 RepID=A0A9X1JLV0_9FLAO|nr:sensor histidine kinase [Winogradskyella luteola]MBV7267745.1 sensor histidine kinase [Winogradskyella luteola]
MKNVPHLKELFIHISVWLCFSLIPITTSFFELDRVPSNVYSKILLMPILFYSNYFIFVPKLLLRRKVLLYIVTSVLFLVVFNYLTIKIVPNASLDTLQEEILKRRGDIPFLRGMRYMMPLIFSLSIFLLGGIFSLVIDFYKRDRLSKQLESNKKEIELQFLRTQLNPHFLFNSLNSIYSLVRSKSDDAEEAVITLSELMRYMLYEVGEAKVPLEKEINYIKHYIALQRLRLKNSEDVKLNIHGETKHLKIHPLLLISFIENAFKYGTDYRGNTHVNILIEINENLLSFKAENIIGFYKKDETNSGVGLKNIENQLNHLYNGSHKLITKTENGYYKVDLSLKLEQNEMHNN